MAIKMINCGLRWTDTDGTPRTSAVAYDKVSGERQAEKLRDGGATDVELVQVTPGRLPQPKA